ncbi:hypothetical protein GCM10009800_21760 [Nocardiopsis rhodophaea]
MVCGLVSEVRASAEATSVESRMMNLSLDGRPLAAFDRDLLDPPESERILPDVRYSTALV